MASWTWLLQVPNDPSCLISQWLAWTKELWSSLLEHIVYGEGEANHTNTWTMKTMGQPPQAFVVKPLIGIASVVASLIFWAKASRLSFWRVVLASTRELENTGIAAPYIKGAGWTFSVAWLPNEALTAIVVYCVQKGKPATSHFTQLIINTNNPNHVDSLLAPCFYTAFNLGKLELPLE